MNELAYFLMQDYIPRLDLITHPWFLRGRDRYDLTPSCLEAHVLERHTFQSVRVFRTAHLF